MPYQLRMEKIYRQTDSEFIEMLNEMRFGSLSPRFVKMLEDLQRDPEFPNDGIVPTQLYATNREANQTNKEELAKIDQPSHYYFAKGEEYRFGELTLLRKSCLAYEELELKVGSQVMMIVNMPEKKLVNGSRGVVARFKDTPYRELPVVKFTDGREITIDAHE